MKVTILKNIKYGGRPYKIGAEVEVSPKHIPEFMSKGIVEDIDLAKLGQDEAMKPPTRKSPDIDNVTKAEIIKILTQRSIKHNAKDRKEILYNLMIEGD